MYTAFKQYLLKLKLSPVSRKLYLSDVSRFLTWLGQEPTLDQVTSATSYVKYLGYLVTQALAPSMLKRTNASLRQFGSFISLTYSLPNPAITLSNTSSSAIGDYIKHFTNYLNSIHLSPLTIKSYKSDITRYLDWGNTHLPSTQFHQLLSDKNIEKYLNHLSQSDNALASTIERKSKSLARIKTWYHDIYSKEYAPDSVVISPSRDSEIGIFKPSSTPDQISSRVKKSNSRISLVPNFMSLVILIIFTATLAIFGYQQFSRDVRLTAAFPNTPVTPNRQLSFQGRLEDASGTPITSATNLTFKLWDNATVGSQLYSTGVCSLTPDSDGVFSTQIGSTCGSAIASSVFTENASVWLEVTVVAETLTPRQPIASVAYALNSETIQGFPISATVSAIRNTIVPMNQWGEIIVGEQNPRLKGVSGTFQISAPSLSFTTSTGTNGNITLAPDGTGQVNLNGNTTSTNFFNVSNAQLTTGSLITGTTANNNVGFKLIDLLSGSSPTSKFSVTDAGNTTAAGSLTLSSLNCTSYTNGGTLTTNGSGLVTCANDDSGVGASSNWRYNLGTLSPLNDTVDLLIGANATSSAKIGFINIGSGTPTINLANQASNITVKDNTASALKIVEGANDYLNLTTTNTTENLAFGNATTNPSYSFLGTGTTTLGGSLATSATSATLFNSTTTTLSLGGAATTAFNIGTGNSSYTAINLGTGTSGNILNIATNNTTKDTLNIGSALDDIILNGSGTGSLINFANFDVTTTGLTTIGADLYLASGLSTFSTAVSNGTLEATKFCTGDGETNCVTDFSALVAGSSYWTRAGTTLSPTTANDVASISSNSISTAPLTLTSSGATATGLSITALSGATANKGINIGAISGAGTGVGVDIGALTNTGISQYGIRLGNISGTHNGGTTAGLTLGNISSTGTTTVNYGIQLGTLTGGANSNYQIQTGNITSIASAINAGLVIGTTKATTGTAASSTNYGIIINPLDSSGTSDTGIYLGAVSGATTNYLINSSAASPTTLGGSLTGINLDLSTNYTVTNLDVTGANFILPTIINTTASTFNYKGLAVSAGTLTQNTGAGTNIWTGLDINGPKIVPTTGTITSYGLKIQQSLANYTGTTWGAYIDGTAGNGLGIFDGASNNTFLIADSGVTTLKPSAFDLTQSCNGASCVSGDTGSFTNHSIEAKSNAGSALTLLPAVAPGSGSLYLGLDHPFNTVNIDIVTANIGMSTMIAEYWNGSTWTTLAVTDGTSLFTVDGTMTWINPTDWTNNSINSVTKYYIRLRNSVGTITTAPTASFITPTTGNRFYVYGQSGDTNPGIFLNDYGLVGIGMTSPLSPLDVAGDIYISSGISSFRTAVSDGTFEATKFCTGDGETNCVTDFSAFSTGINYWRDNLGAISPRNDTLDLLIGSNATNSAKIALININSGTPTATISAGTSGAIYMKADGTIATTAKQTLALGNATTTGNIILQGGNVGIGFANPVEKLEVNGNVIAQRLTDTAGAGAYYLDPAAAGTSLSIDGDIISNGVFSITSNGTNGDITIDAGTGTVMIGAGGAGKLDAGTIDPPYTINGEKYATYMAGMTGVKEETTGVTFANEYISGIGYRSTLDLATSPEGSDLWLFSKASNLKTSLDKLVVLLSSSTNTKTWYEINPNLGKLYLYSLTPTTISYRLTAPRFDAGNWANTRGDDSESVGHVVNDHNPWSVSQVIADAITSGQSHINSLFGNIETNLISPLASGSAITISAPVVITRIDPSSDTPTLYVDGEIEATTISARLAQLQDIQAQNIIAKNIVVDTITANNIIGLDAKIASLSGISETDIVSITDRIKARLAQLTTNTETAQDLPIPEEASNSATPNQSDLNLSSSSLASADIDFVTVNNYLAVIGQAVITDLDVTGHLYATSLNSKTGTLSLANNTLIITASGQVSINGDLTVSGKIIADSASINSLEIGTPNSATVSALGQLLSIYNEAGIAVATIDASGSANLASLTTNLITIASPGDATQSGLASLVGTTQSNATAGESILVSPNTELTIESPYITPNSLIYLTPTTNTDNKVLFVKSKNATSFTIAIDTPASTNISFNWWIIQLKQ